MSKVIRHLIHVREKWDLHVLEIALALDDPKVLHAGVNRSESFLGQYEFEKAIDLLFGRAGIIISQIDHGLDIGRAIDLFLQVLGKFCRDRADGFSPERKRGWNLRGKHSRR